MKDLIIIFVFLLLCRAASEHVNEAKFGLIWGILRLKKTVAKVFLKAIH